MVILYPPSAAQSQCFDWIDDALKIARTASGAVVDA